MKKVLLEASKMRSVEESQEYIKQSFGYGDEYRNDMDSFYEELMSIKEPLEVHLDDSILLADNLGRYGLGLVKLIRDAAHENELIDFIW